jgi:hypothetical protein
MTAPYTRAAWTVILILVVLSTLAIVRCTQSPLDPGEEATRRTATGADHPNVRSTAEEAREETVTSPSTRRSEEGAVSPPDPPGAEPADQVSARFEAASREDFDLVVQFLVYPLDVETRKLLRHVVLNPADRALSGAHIAELDAIVAHYHEVLALPLRHWSATRDQEAVDMVRGGQVEASPAPPVPERRIRSLARMLLDTARHGEPDITLAELESRLRAKPPVGEMVEESHVQYQGRIYRLASIDRMPVSDPLYEPVQFHASEFLGVVCNWFESHAGANPDEIRAVLARAMEWRGPDTRRVR